MRKTMNVYLDNIEKTAVKAELISDTDYTLKGSGGRRFTQVTMKDEENDELVVFLNNRLPYTTFDIDFEFNNEYTLVEETVFTAPKLELSIVAL